MAQIEPFKPDLAPYTFGPKKETVSFTIPTPIKGMKLKPGEKIKIHDPNCGPDAAAVALSGAWCMVTSIVDNGNGTVTIDAVAATECDEMANYEYDNTQFKYQPSKNFALVVLGHLKQGTALSGMLPAKSKYFAESILAKAVAEKPFSKSLAKWYDIICKTVMDGVMWPNSGTSVDHAVPMPLASGGNLLPIYKLFEHASKKLKYPSVTFQNFESLGKVVLRVAGPKSNYVGQINVTNGGPFMSENFYGRIDKEGKFKANPNQPVAKMVSLILALAKFAEFPEKTAGEYGKLTGACCFCNKALTDPKSVAAGYGPVCAEHYGLKAEYLVSKAVAGYVVKDDLAAKDDFIKESWHGVMKWQDCQNEKIDAEMTALKMTEKGVPASVKEALKEAVKPAEKPRRIKADDILF